MNILIFNWHEEFISLLCKTGYNFFIFPISLTGTSPASKKSPFWEPDIPLPSNATVIINPYDLKEYQFDLICCFTGFDLELVFNLLTPKIFIPIFPVPVEIGKTKFNDKKSYDNYYEHLLNLTKQNVKVLYLNETFKDEKIGGYKLDGTILNNKVFFDEADSQYTYKTKFKIENTEGFLEEIKSFFTKKENEKPKLLSPGIVGNAYMRSDIKEGDVSGEKDTLLWHGPVFSHHSLGLVNREIALSLLDTQKINLFFNPKEDTPLIFKEVLEGLPLNPRFEKLEKIYGITLPEPPDFCLHHKWPPLFIPPPLFGHWILFQPWEFGYIPIGWVEPLKVLVDEIWVYSNDNKETFIRSGIPEAKIHVIPLGINPEIYKVAKEEFSLLTSKHFKFIYIGGMSPRKGVDILINAYLKAFTGKDDVCLIIKDYAKPCYGETEIAQLIKEINNNPDSPEIKYLSDNMQEEDIANLLRACDCYVQPYRSEGFGLPIAEACACGLPVIVTGHGSCLDFCNNETAYFIPAKVEVFNENEISAGENCTLVTVDKPFWASPDIDETARLMRYAYNHPEEAKEKGEKAADFIHKNFTWHHTALKILERLKELKSKPVLRYHNAQINNFLQEGKLKFEQNDMGKSIFYFEKVLQLEPNNSQALHALSCIHFTKKQHKEALDYIYKSWQQGMNINDIIAVVFNILMAIKEYELANKFKHLYEKQIIVWKRKEIFDMPLIKESIHWKGEGEEISCPHPLTQNSKLIDVYIQYVKELKEADSDSPASMKIARLIGNENTIQDFNFIQNLKVSEIWVLTEKQKELYKEKGIPEEKLLVVPLVINTSIFNPYVAPADIDGKRKFNFLYSGNFTEEKDFIYNLLDVYLKEFNCSNDIALILYLKADNSSFSDICEQISDYMDKNHSDNLDLADIVLLEHDISLENISSIYASANSIIVPVSEQETDYRSFIAMAMKINVLALDKDNISNRKQLQNAFESQDEAQIEQRYKLVEEKHNLEVITDNLTGHIKNQQFEDLFAIAEQSSNLVYR